MDNLTLIMAVLSCTIVPVVVVLAYKRKKNKG